MNILQQLEAASYNPKRQEPVIERENMVAEWMKGRNVTADLLVKSLGMPKTTAAKTLRALEKQRRAYSWINPSDRTKWYTLTYSELKKQYAMQ